MDVRVHVTDNVLICALVHVARQVVKLVVLVVRGDALVPAWEDVTEHAQVLVIIRKERRRPSRLLKG